MNPAIGTMQCPLGQMAGEDHQAEVVRESKGARALYLRCGECGTLQPRKPGGQEIMERLKAEGLIHLSDPDEAADNAAHQAGEEAAAEAGREQKRGGAFARAAGRAAEFFTSDEEGL